jgi:hypothetical protein
MACYGDSFTLLRVSQSELHYNWRPVSQHTYIIYILCYTQYTIKYNTIQLNIYIVLYTFTKDYNKIQYVQYI